LRRERKEQKNQAEARSLVESVAEKDLLLAITVFTFAGKLTRVSVYLSSVKIPGIGQFLCKMQGVNYTVLFSAVFRNSPRYNDI
jgi:hypothetical protein